MSLITFARMLYRLRIDYLLSARPRIRHIPQIYLGISMHLLVPHIDCLFFSGIGTHAVDVVLNLEIEGSPMFDTDV